MLSSRLTSTGKTPASTTGAGRPNLSTHPHNFFRSSLSESLALVLAGRSSGLLAVKAGGDSGGLSTVERAPPQIAETTRKAKVIASAGAMNKRVFVAEVFINSPGARVSRRSLDVPGKR